MMLYRKGSTICEAGDTAWTCREVVYKAEDEPQWEQTAQLCNDVLSKDEQVCKRGEDWRAMIGCDNEHCRIQWFHFSCLKMKPK